MNNGDSCCGAVPSDTCWALRTGHGAGLLPQRPLQHAAHVVTRGRGSRACTGALAAESPLPLAGGPVVSDGSVTGQ